MSELVEDDEKYLQIMDYRNTFFANEQTMHVLADILFVILGFDTNGEPDNTALQIKQNCGRKILARLGILHDGNRFDIIQALAGLPLKKEAYSAIKGQKPLIGGTE